MSESLACAKITNGMQIYGCSSKTSRLALSGKIYRGAVALLVLWKVYAGGFIEMFC